MYKQPTKYDADAFPPSLGFFKVFLTAIVVGVLAFELAAATLLAA